MPILPQGGAMKKKKRSSGSGATNGPGPVDSSQCQLAGAGIAGGPIGLSRVCKGIACFYCQAKDSEPDPCLYPHP